MATHNATPAYALVKHQRQLKVCKVCDSQQNAQKAPIGQILLKGQWLQAAKFEIDQVVNLKIMPECIVLTTQAAPVDLLAGFNQLGQREQQILKTLTEELLIKYQH